jgi:hypothetical protein
LRGRQRWHGDALPHRLLLSRGGVGWDALHVRGPQRGLPYHGVRRSAVVFGVRNRNPHVNVDLFGYCNGVEHGL